MAPLAAFAVAAAPVVAAGAGVYAVVEGRRQAKKAQSAADEFAQREWETQERQAGEYFDLTQKQMTLQAQTSNIKTLVDLIRRKSGQAAEPRIYTLPKTETLTPVAQINQAIDRLFRAA